MLEYMIYYQLYGHLIKEIKAKTGGIATTTTATTTTRGGGIEVATARGMDGSILVICYKRYRSKEKVCELNICSNLLVLHTINHRRVKVV